MRAPKSAPTAWIALHTIVAHVKTGRPLEFLRPVGGKVPLGNFRTMEGRTADVALSDVRLATPVEVAVFHRRIRDLRESFHAQKVVINDE